MHEYKANKHTFHTHIFDIKHSRYLFYLGEMITLLP